MRHGAGQILSRGACPDQQTHDQAQIVAGDVHEITFLQVLAAAQPSGSARSPGGMSAELTGPAHAATIEHERKAALDQLGSEPERFPGHT